MFGRDCGVPRVVGTGKHLAWGGSDRLGVAWVASGGSEADGWFLGWCSDGRRIGASGGHCGWARLCFCGNWMWLRWDFCGGWTIFMLSRPLAGGVVPIVGRRSWWR